MGLRRNPDGVSKAIAQAKKVALCAHVSPDGDTVGSTLALRLGLMQLGKVVAVFCQDKIPDNLHFLCGADAFRTADSMENETFDLTVAVDAADVVLMNSRLLDVSAAIRLSRATLRNIHENLFWAFFYNVIGIPLAAGVWYPVFGWKLNPMFGAAAMSLSSFCVVTNALRLNLFSVHGKANKKAVPAAKPTEMKISESEETKMTKTMHIEGMMCGHCEATVKKALEALPEVTSAEVSHEAGTAVVTSSTEVADDVLKKTVEEKDYKVTAID